MIEILVTACVTVVCVLVALNFATAEKRIGKRVRHYYPAGSDQFLRSMGLLLGPGIVEGNRIDTLVNGDRIFPAMLASIAEAERSITFETFVYWGGDVGRRFAEALAAAARKGVAVHVLLDWVGSATMEDGLLDLMVEAGAQVRRYHPPHWHHISRMNNRTHRKLLVVDGKIGFTGGVGIADKWDGDAQSPEHWRDTHFRVEGPVVAQMQAVFMDNWIKVSGEVLHGAVYFPALAPRGELAAHMFSSSPSGGSESMHLMYLMLIAAAERTIDLQASYFVPDRLVVRALLDALKRGVRVRVMVPGRHIDAGIVRRASQGLWGALLNAGVEMYEFLPTMFHCKVMVVDGLVTSVGSTNFDPRSFRLNDEANLNVYDAGFADEQERLFERDLAACRRVTLARWRRRPRWRRMLERGALLLRSQL